MSLAENAATIRPAPCAHGSRSLRPMHMGPVFCVRTLVGSPVAAVSSDSPACDLALFAHPFVEGAASGHLQRSFIDDRQRCFAPEVAVHAVGSRDKAAPTQFMRLHLVKLGAVISGRTV